MSDPSPVLVVGAVVFNLLWLTLYALVIRRGFLEKTFGIPAVALVVNLTWDVIGTVVLPSPMPQLAFNVIYIVLDLIIIYQVARFWRSDFANVPPLQFYGFAIFTLIFSFALMYSFIVEFNDLLADHAAWIDTFINSALFIAMFYRRPDLLGQSLYIGLCKLIGTGAMMLGLTISPWPGTENWITLPVLYVGIFILDLAYVLLVYQRGRALRIDIWRRF
jgi:hypothetical protein